MKTIIAGSRTLTNYDTVLDAVVNSGFIITKILSGGARGVDSVGEVIARDFNIPIAVYPADWNTLGKVAGFIRNEAMALDADALIAVWDGRSPGTKHMIKLANRLKLKVYIENY